MKKYFLLFLLLYLFGVLIRIVGQLMNGQSISWKSTLLLGEFDGSQDFDKRWFLRIALMLLLPVFFIKPLTKK